MLQSASGGGVSGLGGVCLVWGGVPGPGGCPWSGGVSGPGGIPACTEADTPPVDRHTLVKTLPWPNFVAAGKYAFCSKLNCCNPHLS